MRKFVRAGAAIGALSFAVVAVAAQSSNLTWMPPVPGTIVQQSPVAFNGEHAASQWRAIVSKQLVGSGNGERFYQWYLSIYVPRQGAYRLRYQSPKGGGPLSHVEQANGSKMWFPIADIRIVGTAQLMRPGTQQLVVQSHEMAADCGSAAVTIFSSKPGDSAGAAVTVGNYCDLQAKIAAGGSSIELTGPYYAANAALCCPTKSRASATLRYRDGKWSESPNYFKFE